jgi:membrane protease YdiL (CAAX protease family)
MNQLIDSLSIKASYTMVLIICGYYTYYFPAFSSKTADWFKAKYGQERSKIYLFLFQKILGFLMLGPVAALLFYPFFSLNTSNSNFSIQLPVSPWSITAFLIILIVILIYFSARKSDVYERVPHMRLKEWNTINILTSITGWGLYLLGYEFIFRQLLLFTWAEAFGVIPAIVVNLALYSAFHLPNGRKETIGSIFFGLVLCLLSLQTGTFILAFLLHFTLSVSTEMFSIHHNPSMRFNLKKVTK